MTKQIRNGRKRSCKTSCLTFTFFNICKLLLDKKKKKENCCQSRKFFSLQIKCFLIFVKVLNVKFVPKITIHESFCQKFRDFLIPRKFLFAKVSAPKLIAKIDATSNSDTFSLKDILANFIFII